MIKPTPQTENKRRRESERDLVDRIFDLLVSEFPDVATKAAEIKRAIRRDVGGERAYVKAERRGERAAQANERFNGRNASEVARELGIGRSTVYRLLKQPGRP